MICLSDKILFHSFQLFMRLGVKSVSMDDIAATLGMSKKTLYQYFSTKKELVKKAVQAYIEEDEKIVNDICKNAENAVDAKIKVGRHVLNFFRQMSPSTVHDLQKYHRETWSIVEKQHFTFIYSTIKKNIERGKNENLYRQDVNADIIAKLYVQMCMSVTNEKIFSLRHYERVQLLKELIIYHIHGLLNPDKKELFQSLAL